MKTLTQSLFSLGLLFGLTACQNAGMLPNALGTQATATDCQAAQLESDGRLDPRLGAAGDPEQWQDFPPEAIVASTYLQFQAGPETQTQFQTLMGPISQTLMGPAEGLLALSFRFSDHCNAVRTLSVWESEAAMMQFVLSDAHLKAMGQIGDISRGGSATSHWSRSSFETLNWKSAVLRFENHNGPHY